jgi:hypothetical protein
VVFLNGPHWANISLSQVSYAIMASCLIIFASFMNKLIDSFLIVLGPRRFIKFKGNAYALHFIKLKIWRVSICSFLFFQFHYSGRTST